MITFEFYNDPQRLQATRCVDLQTVKEMYTIYCYDRILLFFCFVGRLLFFVRDGASGIVLLPYFYINGNMFYFKLFMTCQTSDFNGNRVKDLII